MWTTAGRWLAMAAVITAVAAPREPVRAEQGEAVFAEAPERLARTDWERFRWYILGTTVLLVAQTALIAGLLVQRRRRRQAEDAAHGSRAEVEASYDRIRDMGRRLIRAQEDERARIARELHDDISQQVALLTIDVDLLVAADAPDAAADQAIVARARLDELARSIHDLSHRLHPTRLRLIGLVPALHGLRHELSHAGLSITVTDTDVPAGLPPELTLCLFRVVQESLRNAANYSGARHVSVDLRAGPQGLALIIEDDGAGFDVHSKWGSGLGLVSMSERVEALGGTLDVQSDPGAGTRIHVSVPLDDARAVAV